MTTASDVVLHAVEAAPSSVVLRPVLVTVASRAAFNVYLYAGEVAPASVVLSDTTRARPIPDPDPVSSSVRSAWRASKWSASKWNVSRVGG